MRTTALENILVGRGISIRRIRSWMIAYPAVVLIIHSLRAGIQHTLDTAWRLFPHASARRQGSVDKLRAPCQIVLGHDCLANKGRTGGPPKIATRLQRVCSAGRVSSESAELALAPFGAYLHTAVRSNCSW